MIDPDQPLPYSLFQIKSLRHLVDYVNWYNQKLSDLEISMAFGKVKTLGDHVYEVRGKRAILTQRDALDVMMSAVQYRIQEMQGQDIVRILWAYTKLGQNLGQIWPVLKQNLIRCQEDLTVKDVSVILFALGKLGLKDSQIIDELCVKKLVSFPRESFQVQEIGQIAAAIKPLEIKNAKLNEILISRAKQVFKEMSPPQFMVFLRSLQNMPDCEGVVDIAVDFVDNKNLSRGDVLRIVYALFEGYPVGEGVNSIIVQHICPQAKRFQAMQLVNLLEKLNELKLYEYEVWMMLGDGLAYMNLMLEHDKLARVLDLFAMARCACIRLTLAFVPSKYSLIQTREPSYSIQMFSAISILQLQERHTTFILMFFQRFATSRGKKQPNTLLLTADDWQVLAMLTGMAAMKKISTSVVEQLWEVFREAQQKMDKEYLHIGYWAFELLKFETYLIDGEVIEGVKAVKNKYNNDIVEAAYFLLQDRVKNQTQNKNTQIQENIEL